MQKSIITLHTKLSQQESGKRNLSKRTSNENHDYESIDINDA